MDPIQKNILKRNETSEMTERELLMELVEEKRRAETWRYISLAWHIFLLLVIIIVLAKYLPGIIKFFKDMYDMLHSVQETANQISTGYQDLTESINGINFGKLSFGDLLQMFSGN